MGTSLPANLVKTSADNELDDPKQWRAETAGNVDKTNALFAALGVAAFYDLGNGLGVSTQAAGFNDLLQIRASASFRFSSGGTLEPSDFFVVESDDDEAGHAAPPDLNLRRKKTAITAGDVLGELKFRGSNAAAKENNIIYAELLSTIIDAAAGSEDADLRLRTIFAGALDDRFKVAGGMWSKASGVDATGTDKGPGTINVNNGFYKQGALLPFQTEQILGPVTPTPAAGGTLSHSLSERPRMVVPELINTTAELGFTLGDPYPLAGYQDSGSDNFGVAVASRAAEIEYRIGTAGLRVLRLDTGAGATITTGNWDLQFRCYAP